MADGGTRCAICGAVAEDAHHLTSRGLNLSHLDPNLKVPLCHDCHELQGDDRRHQGIEKPLRSTNPLEIVERSARGVGVFLGRLGAATEFSWCLLLAAACVSWAETLHGVITALDRWNGGWRDVV
jgi:hypothetical protein